MTSCDCVKTIIDFDNKIYPQNFDSITVLLNVENQGYFSRGFSISIDNKQKPITAIIEGYASNISK